MSETKKTIRFYFALFLAKIVLYILKLFKRNGTHFPGYFALKLCPDFLKIIDKPSTIIGVTGTNGKTTVCNMICSVLSQNGYDFISNKYGSNIPGGIVSTIIQGSTLTGRAKTKIAVLEIDERSTNKIFPYLTPTYLVCTNIFRDSLQRNAHTEFIAAFLNKYIPRATTIITNADDLISSHIAKENPKIFFSIAKLPTDTQEFQNITRDIRICPNCSSLLEYDYVRYHHIGKAHCPNCDYGSLIADYTVTKIDVKNQLLFVQYKNQQEKYHLISDNIINIYNMLASIIVLKQLGLNHFQINNTFSNLKIVETRFSEETYNNYKIITYLAKGMNPIACSRAFDYVRKDSGKKAVIAILDDLHEDSKGIENIAWQYDTDYEFLNDSSIKQIIIAGPRYLDTYLRLLLANIDTKKIVYEKDFLKATSQLQLQDIDKIFILHDLYSITQMKKIKQKVKEKIEKER